MKNIRSIRNLLRKKQITIEKGLSEEEIMKAETFYCITFPQDYKDFLKQLLPISTPFYNWRDYSSENVKHINSMLQFPLEGFLFDVEKNNFWLKEWGEKPADKQQREKIVKEFMKNVPILIPIYSHRYISSFPKEAGNPVYSVYQTDIIFYGENILDYFNKEFNQKNIAS